jgi:hypothetical protein
MTIAITVGVTLLTLFLFSATYRAGMRKGSVDTIVEIRRAVALAGLQGSLTGSQTVH